MMRIFGHKTDKMLEKSRKLSNDQLHNSFYSPGVVIKWEGWGCRNLQSCWKVLTKRRWKM